MPLVKTISILLVEDSLPDARYVQQMLPSRAYEVLHTSSLAAAENCISNHVFDAILLDLSLPDANGLEAFEEMLGWSPTIPIVILTGLDDEDSSMRAVKLGAQDYVLKKEISEYTLSRAIRYAIERKGFDEHSKRLAVLESREEFMATLTHDLKNPLIGANRILELMAEQVLGVVSVEQAQLLLKLRDNNKLLISMIQNLIEVYKFEKDVHAVSLENTDLLQILSLCIDDVAPIALNRAISLNTQLPETLNEIPVDPGAIRRVLQNLLDNALKFTPNGGRINLAVRSINGSVQVEVQDNGPGMSSEEHARLFQRFSQGRVGKKYTPGIGLGLYLCKQIIDAHRGKITCKTKEGEGCTFTVTIPAV